MLQFDKPKEKEVMEIPDLDSIKIDQGAEPEIKEIPDLETSEIEKEMGLGTDIPGSPTTRKIEAPPIDTPAKVEEIPDEGPAYQPPSPFDEKVEPPPLDIPPVVEDTSPKEPVVEIPPMEAPPIKEDILQEEPPVREFEMPAPPTEPPPIKEDMLQREPPVREYEVPAPPTEAEKPSISTETGIPPEEKIKVTEQMKQEKKEMPSIQKEELLNRVEDKLSVAIKEVLWEIVPPLAEKLITKEIEDIKAEVSKSFT
jgi:hypothetical protein